MLWRPPRGSRVVDKKNKWLTHIEYFWASLIQLQATACADGRVRADQELNGRKSEWKADTQMIRILVS